MLTLVPLCQHSGKLISWYTFLEISPLSLNSAWQSLELVNVDILGVSHIFMCHQILRYPLLLNQICKLEINFSLLKTLKLVTCCWIPKCRQWHNTRCLNFKIQGYVSKRRQNLPQKMNSLFSIKNMCEDKLLDIYYLMYWRKCVQWTGPKNPNNIFKTVPLKPKLLMFLQIK